MKSQGDTVGVVLVTIATQLLPGHGAQTSLEPGEASMLGRMRTRYGGGGVAGGNKRLEGGSGVEGHMLAAAVLPRFNLMIPFKVASQPRVP